MREGKKNVRMCCGSPEQRCAAHGTGVDPARGQAACNLPVVHRREDVFINLVDSLKKINICNMQSYQ